jgi:hypothetical protein
MNIMAFVGNPEGNRSFRDTDLNARINLERILKKRNWVVFRQNISWCFIN